MRLQDRTVLNPSLLKSILLRKRLHLPNKEFLILTFYFEESIKKNLTHDRNFVKRTTEKSYFITEIIIVDYVKICNFLTNTKIDLYFIKSVTQETLS